MSFVLRRSTVSLVRRYSSRGPWGPSKGGLPKKHVQGPKTNPLKAGANPMPELEKTKEQIALKPNYQPQESYQRVSFEYPTETTSTSSSTPHKLKRYLPHLLLILGGGWALFTVRYFTQESIPQDYLDPEEFIPFIVTQKVDVDKDHYFIELTPKYNHWKKEFMNPIKVWNGRRIWSVEIKQPQIMVVRKYTPLPLTIYKPNKDSTPVINIQNNDINSPEYGKLVFYIKKYDQGEVARWISRKSIGSELELRGPFIEFEFPSSPNDVSERPKMENLPSKVNNDPEYKIKPDNLAFFGAGTGIAPILQVLLSENPYKGFVNVFYSRRTEAETPIPRLLYFLEKLDRVKFHHFINENNSRLNSKPIPTPIEPHFKAYEDQLIKNRQDEEQKIAEKLKELRGERSYTRIPEVPKDHSASLESKTPSTQSSKFKTILEKIISEGKSSHENPSLALVCGPDGFVSYVAGPKPFEGQGPVGGLLKEKGWDETNVFKLS
ncbi:putative nitrate reductase [NADH] [Wickerhamomyces ciferrii]|uniref:Nitrate reductase [NADH] n=1 Tax=Wickerhamomyces ciferrii (strain ATCC 14091 / BCRC 22168 / CBS 111 / JCM 3599 / NBRC 0793 / NRRL Y-1031 F-60-10) TaxID=1206466 RepID=K0KFC1_WICCF|nr:putative nitrate reductase [NADH] [Wickerhamomyces ciferrii]CCH43810.1 putative nitrate reductase [NADH] [Wickerhamomyces ciferrii]